MPINGQWQCTSDDMVANKCPFGNTDSARENNAAACRLYSDWYPSVLLESKIKQPVYQITDLLDKTFPIVKHMQQAFIHYIAHATQRLTHFVLALSYLHFNFGTLTIDFRLTNSVCVRPLACV